MGDRIPASNFDDPQFREYHRARALHPDAAKPIGDLVEAQMLECGPRLLDIGAGTGRFRDELERRGVRYFSAEPSEGMLAQAHASPTSVRSRAEVLPFRDASFDLCFLSMVLHHLDLERAGREMARVLAPGGRAIARNHFAGRLQGVPVYDWFPAARAVDDVRLPTLDEVVAALAPVGPCSVVTIDHVLTGSLGDLRRRFEARSESVLGLVTDADFAAGLDAIDAAILDGRGDEVVHTQVDVVIAGGRGAWV